MTDMIHAEVLTSEEAVDAYLTKHGLLEGAIPLEAILLQGHGTALGFPAVMLIATVGGKKHVIKTSLKLLIAATGALNGVVERERGPNWRGP